MSRKILEFVLYTAVGMLILTASYFSGYSSGTDIAPIEEICKNILLEQLEQI